MSKHLLLLGFGTQALRYIEEAKQKDCFLSAADTEKYHAWPSNQEYVKMIDNPLIFNNFYYETFLQTAVQAQMARPLDAIIPLADGHVVPAALMQEKHGLRGAGLIAALLSTNKAAQRQVFKADGVSIPDFVMVTKETAAELLKGKNYPLVIKPVNMFGSVGVKVVQNYDEALAHVAEIEQFNPTMLVEEYIQGPEFSVESLVQDGEIIFTNITRKYVGPEPNFVESGHMIPFAGLTDAQREHILQVNRSAIQAMQVKDSITHLEARLSERGPVIMEIAVRQPGDRIMDLIELSTGFNIYEGVVNIMLGNKIAPVKTKDASVYVHWFFAKQKGKIKAIKGTEKITALPQTRMFEIMRAVGDEMNGVASTFDRLGYCLVELESPSQVEEMQKLLNSLLEVEVE